MPPQPPGEGLALVRCHYCGLLWVFQHLVPPPHLDCHAPEPVEVVLALTRPIAVPVLLGLNPCLVGGWMNDRCSKDSAVQLERWMGRQSL